MLLKINSTEASSEQQHNSYILEKFYSLSSAVARSILRTSNLGVLQGTSRGNGIDYTFRMSQEERVIMQKQSSVLLMGRSGTGKIQIVEKCIYSLSRKNYMCCNENVEQT